jgi:hypothetical protein
MLLAGDTGVAGSESIMMSVTACALSVLHSSSAAVVGLGNTTKDSRKTQASTFRGRLGRKSP